MSHRHAETLNVNQASISAKMEIALIQFKFVMVKINAVIIQKKVKIAIVLFALINNFNVRHRQIDPHFALIIPDDAMAFR